MKRFLLLLLSSLLLTACQQAHFEPIATKEATSTSTATAPKGLGTAFPSPQPLGTVTQARVHDDGFQRGVNVLMYGDQQSFDTKFELLLGRLVADNVTNVSLNIPIYQKEWDSSEVTTFEYTPSDEMVTSAIQRAHAHGLSVTVRPLIDERGINQSPGKWRGVIDPKDPAKWHESYNALILRYAKIAEQERAELLCIGVELVTMTTKEYVPYWNVLIDSVRKAYAGKLTYSQNHNAIDMDTGFWDRMDYVGIDAFYQLDAPLQPTLDQLEQAWNPHLKVLENLQKKFGKPILLTEVGATSEKGSFREPWNWHHGTGVDVTTHGLYYTATCKAARKATSGLYFWAANLDPPNNPLLDEGFDFQGKPSEAALRTCYG